MTFVPCTSDPGESWKKDGLKFCGRLLQSRTASTNLKAGSTTWNERPPVKSPSTRRKTWPGTRGNYAENLLRETKLFRHIAGHHHAGQPDHRGVPDAGVRPDAPAALLPVRRPGSLPGRLDPSAPQNQEHRRELQEARQHHQRRAPCRRGGLEGHHRSHPEPAAAFPLGF